MNRILGIRYGHDASAALIIDGKIIADVAEERFTRIKNDGSFPINAIEYCFKAAGIKAEQLDAVVFPSQGYIPEPFFAFFKVPEEVFPINNRPQVPILPIYMEPWVLSKKCKVLTIHHHLAHAASAFYTSGVSHQERCLVVTMDGRGDFISTAIWRGEKNHITPLRQWDGSSSLGWFYANATEGLGWRHGSDEWKTMGLAPYGTPKPGKFKGYYPEFKNGELIKEYDFGEASRWPDHGVNHYHMRDALPLSKIVEELGREDYSAEVQRVAEEQATEIIMPWLAKENTGHLCCAGGFFLNVKFNQRMWYSGALDTHWTFPDPGDSGLAVGSALYVYYSNHPEQPAERLEHMYYGPQFGSAEIESLLQERKIKYEKHENISEVAARYVAENKIIAWFQGRMEAGPRALGNRSIVMSPLRAENKDLINACVKYREAFRPFAPSMLADKVDDYLVKGREEPYMITSFDVKEEKKDKIPAVVHVDGTSRPQTVRREVNPRYYDLIKAFGDLTGENVVLNTSFNVKGEPIICHPREAIRCFFDTGLDVLVMENFLLKKSNI